MIVMKFGGTSTQDAEAMRNVARIVKSRIDQQPIVVISAVARATNMLEFAGKSAAEGKLAEAQTTVSEFVARHDDIVEMLVTDPYRKSALKAAIVQAGNELGDIVKGVAILRELTPRTLDSIYCYGELLSSRLVAAALEEINVPSEWVDTKDFLITDERHTRAMPIMDIVEEKLQNRIVPLVAQGKVVVTQGFIGMTPSGRRTTMGRESSDYSATIIGAGIGATDVEIWTDVDGILTADPAVVEIPKKLRILPFQEAFELAYFGAKVLHPNTMLPAVDRNIPIQIYNSRRPGQSGTTVTATSDENTGLVKSIAYKRNIVQLTISPLKRFGIYIFWEHVFNILTRYNAVPLMTSTSEYSMSIALEGRQNLQPIVHELQEVADVECTDGRAVLCLVGANLRGAPLVMRRVFDGLDGDEIYMMSFGATASSIGILLDDKAVLQAVRRLHKEFFEADSNTDLFEDLAHYHSRV